jgi:UDP-glucose/GDP-mannose dehydrogenase family, NAD binding domain
MAETLPVSSSSSSSPTYPSAKNSNFESSSREDTPSNSETFPSGYVNSGFYPDTPPVSAQSRADLALSPPSLSGSLLPDQDEKNPVIAVLGVGYVGSHLVDVFLDNFSVIGYDVSESRVCVLRDQYAENAAAAEFTNDPNDMSRATHFLIAVPTLLRADKSIDSSYLRDAIRTVGRVARRGSTVVIESSVAVGMTRQLLGPLAASRGLFAGMSPEVSSSHPFHAPITPVD